MRLKKEQKNGLLELISYSKRIGDISMVEIGCWEGESTIMFANAPHIKRVIAIDPFVVYDCGTVMVKEKRIRDAESRFYRKIKGNNVIQHLKKSSTDAIPDVDMVDLVYIDGAHTYGAVKSDITNWSKKVRVGGIISGHDFCDEFSGVKKAVGEYLQENSYDEQAELVTFQDSSWAIIKK
jgi:predicted O-methyltransferase YrrM